MRYLYLERIGINDGDQRSVGDPDIQFIEVPHHVTCHMKGRESGGKVLSYAEKVILTECGAHGPSSAGINNTDEWHAVTAWHKIPNASPLA